MKMSATNSVRCNTKACLAEIDSIHSRVILCVVLPWFYGERPPHTDGNNDNGNFNQSCVVLYSRYIGIFTVCKISRKKKNRLTK